MTTWCRFKTADRTSYGIVEGDQVIAVEGTPFGPYRRSGARLPARQRQARVPVAPRDVLLRRHQLQGPHLKMAKKRGVEPSFPPKPDIGYRTNNALIAHEEDIVKPADAGEAFQYEGELVAVFGKTLPQRVERGSAGLRVRLDHRQRRQRAQLAEDRPHAVARQEFRHLQADGAVDRHRGSTPTT